MLVQSLNFSNVLLLNYDFEREIAWFIKAEVTVVEIERTGNIIVFHVKIFCFRVLYDVKIFSRVLALIASLSKMCVLLI